MAQDGISVCVMHCLEPDMSRPVTSCHVLSRPVTSHVSALRLLNDLQEVYQKAWPDRPGSEADRSYSRAVALWEFRIEYKYQSNSIHAHFSDLTSVQILSRLTYRRNWPNYSSSLAETEPLNIHIFSVEPASTSGRSSTKNGMYVTTACVW